MSVLKDKKSRSGLLMKKTRVLNVSLKMERFPNDPVMLMSYVNTKLRDYYSSLDALCDDMNVDRDILETRLSEAGFEYNPQTNRFW